jgi:hypothetical protein
MVDSLSHAWAGINGILEIVDQTASRMKTPNNFAAWATETPQHNQLIETLLGTKLHLIVTMRAKMKHIQQTNEKTGKTEVVKVGMEAVQRDGLEYEFDIIGDLDISNTMHITKTRCSELRGRSFFEPGAEVAEVIMDWLNTGEGAPTPPPTANPMLSRTTGEPPYQPPQEQPPARPKNTARSPRSQAPESASDTEAFPIFAKNRTPLRPEALIEGLQTLSKTLGQQNVAWQSKASPEAVERLAIALGAMEWRDTQRYAFLEEVFGVGSYTALLVCQGLALKTWVESNLTTARSEFEDWVFYALGLKEEEAQS